MRVTQRPVPDGQPLQGLSPLLDRIYRSRGISESDELDHSLGQLLPISSLGNVEQAAELVANAIRRGDSIVVVGDYDADGATACSVCMRGLGAMGAEINYVVPDRKKHGYGLSSLIVEKTLQYDPALLITVDNGISSIEGVEAAREAGMAVVVTDHHLPGAELPRADVIVNPNQEGESFSSPHLAGVGVAFYLVCAVQKNLGAPFNPASLLDLVAVGTVADVVVLDRNNRILVERGMERIRRGATVPGISALLEVAGRDSQRIVASDLGFAVAPRINAAGRMAEMGAGIDCLLAESRAQALPQAERLDGINRERREVEEGIRQEAEQIIHSLHLGEEQPAAGLALYQPHWHEGVIGIVAGRIKERLHRPVVVFARGEGGMLKGSARSIPGLHIRDLLDALSRSSPGLIASFGGHAMAAGLSIDEHNFEPFHQRFRELASEWADEEILDGALHTDGSLCSEERTLESAAELRNAGPWGQGFPEPLFHDTFVLEGWRVVGEKHLKLRLLDGGSGEVLDAIAFFQSEESLPVRGEALEVVYRLDVNRWRGQETLQLVVESIV